jgi:hypothetical protein
MRAFIISFSCCLLLACTSQPLCAQDSDTITYEKSYYSSLDGLPIVEDLGIHSPLWADFGAMADSAYRQKDIAGMLSLVAVLYSFEKASDKKSDFTTSEQLMKVVDQMMDYRLTIRYELTLVELYKNVHKDLEIPLSAERTLIIKEKHLEYVNGTLVITSVPEVRADANIKLTVINKTKKLLYLYVNDEFVGPIYGGQEKELLLREKCEHVCAETVTFDKSGKKICAQKESTYEWVIEK